MRNCDVATTIDNEKLQREDDTEYVDQKFYRRILEYRTYSSWFWTRWSQYETDSPISPIIIFLNINSILDLFKVIIDTFKIKIEFFLL